MASLSEGLRFWSVLQVVNRIRHPDSFCRGDEWHGAFLNRALRWLVFPDRAHFDAAPTRTRYLCSNLNRIVEIGCFDEVDAAELLLGFCKGTVGGQCLSISHAHRGRGVCGRKSLRGDELAAFLDC